MRHFGGVDMYLCCSWENRVTLEILFWSVFIQCRPGAPKKMLLMNCSSSLWEFWLSIGDKIYIVSTLWRFRMCFQFSVKNRKPRNLTKIVLYFISLWSARLGTLYLLVHAIMEFTEGWECKLRLLQVSKLFELLRGEEFVHNLFVR